MEPQLRFAGKCLAKRSQSSPRKKIRRQARKMVQNNSELRWRCSAGRRGKASLGVDTDTQEHCRTSKRTGDFVKVVNLKPARNGHSNLQEECSAKGRGAQGATVFISCPPSRPEPAAPPHTSKRKNRIYKKQCRNHKARCK